MLSEFEKKMLSLTGVNNDSKTKQLMNFMATQHSRKVYISEDEYKNTLLGTWLKKNGLNKTDGSGWVTNTNYLLRMSKQAILKYANYFKERNLGDVYLSGSYAKKHKIEVGENSINRGAPIDDGLISSYAFDFYFGEEENLEFYYGDKINGKYYNPYTIYDIIEKPLDYIELEFEYYEGVSEMYSDVGDFTIFDYIAINEPQRQYIDDRGLFEVRNGEDGHFYALVLSYVDETSIKYLVLSHTGAITLFDPENDGFKSLEDLETVDGENATELENVFAKINEQSSAKIYGPFVMNSENDEIVAAYNKSVSGDIIVVVDNNQDYNDENLYIPIIVHRTTSDMGYQQIFGIIETYDSDDNDIQLKAYVVFEMTKNHDANDYLIAATIDECGVEKVENTPNVFIGDADAIPNTKTFRKGDILILANNGTIGALPSDCVFAAIVTAVNATAEYTMELIYQGFTGTLNTINYENYLEFVGQDIKPVGTKLYKHVRTITHSGEPYILTIITDSYTAPAISKTTANELSLKLNGTFISVYGNTTLQNPLLVVNHNEDQPVYHVYVFNAGSGTYSQLIDSNMVVGSDIVTPL